MQKRRTMIAFCFTRILFANRKTEIYREAEMVLTRRQKLHSFFNVEEGNKYWQAKWCVYNQLLDHGFVRRMYNNFYELDEDLFRSAQPNEKTLSKFQKLGGQTVLSLRGCTTAPYWYQEEKHCRNLGLSLHNIPLAASKAPSVDDLKVLIDFLGNAPKPLLIHCKSGADRTGLAAFIYLTVFKSCRFTVAKRQLSVKYFHNPFGKAGVLDKFVDRFWRDQRLYGINFEEWLYTRYDREQFENILEIETKN